jgi:hypothetical protein
MADWPNVLGRLPWRGPEVPVQMDGPDDQRPVETMSIQVDLLDLETPAGRQKYAEVLNRAETGFVRVLDQKLEGFKLLLVWGEKYMCGPGFVPQEGRPVLCSNELSNPAFAGEDVPVKKPEFGTPVPIAKKEDVKPAETAAPAAAPVKLKARELKVE